MYSINGVPLDNPTLGWELLATSEPLSAFSVTSTQLQRTGRDGVETVLSSRGTVTLQFTVRTPKENYGALLNLFALPELTVVELTNPARSATGLLRSSAPKDHFPKADFYSHQFLVEIPSGTWRGTEQTSSALTPVAGGATLTLLSGLTAPVQDALVRVKGPITNPQIVDSSGAFFIYEGTLTSSQYVRFDSGRGRAWRTTSSTWTGGTEVSGLIDYGGPRGLFEIAPYLPTPTDPRVTEGRLTLTQETFSAGAALQVRGRTAILY